jgi:hypothetical protein
MTLKSMAFTSPMRTSASPKVLSDPSLLDLREPDVVTERGTLNKPPLAKFKLRHYRKT